MVERLNCDIIIVDTMKPIQKIFNSKLINECQEKKAAMGVQKDKNR
jgi:hypothetical protein